MRVVNLATFVALVVFAVFVNWLTLQLFPWQGIEEALVSDMISHAVAWEKANPPVTITSPGTEYYRNTIENIVRAHNIGQHILGYLLAGVLSMLALRFGERQLFPRQAYVNWKLALPFWLAPAGYVVLMGYDSHADIFRFIFLANSVMLLFLGVYAFAYQTIGAFKSRRSATA